MARETCRNPTWADLIHSKLQKGLLTYIHIQKSQQSELLGLLVLYRKEEKRITSLSPSMHTHIQLCLRIVGPQPLFLSQKVAQHNKVQVQQLISN